MHEFHLLLSQAEGALVRRQGIEVTTLWRERGAFDREGAPATPR